jgi:hypothetical protein
MNMLHSSCDMLGHVLHQPVLYDLGSVRISLLNRGCQWLNFSCSSVSAALFCR